MKPFVSLICPIYNEEKHIEKCVESLLAQDYPRDRMEILFVDGMSADRTREILDAFQAKYAFIRMFDNPGRTAPYALNIGIGVSQGEVVMRVDAHSAYPPDYVSRLAESLIRLGADNVGGLWNTLPAADTPVCRAIAVASSHVFGVGLSVHKVGADKVRQVDTVPFGCFRREVFDRVGLFDTELTRNQDDEFNGRIIKNGGRIYLIPSVRIDYTARDTIGKAARMYYQYGLFKPLVNKKLGAPATLRQFFPALFVLGIVAGAVWSVFSPIILWIYLGVWSLYLLFGVSFGVREAARFKDWRFIFTLPCVFFVIHTAYGLGYWKGLYNVLLRRPFRAGSNR